MDSVAAQPSAPAATRSSGSRFGQLLKRRSASTKDLNKMTTYDNYAFSPFPPSTSASPLDINWPSGSRSPTYTNTTTTNPFGLRSNKSRFGRSAGDSSKGGDADYIPYRGPISPPSGTAPSFAQQQKRSEDKNADQRLPLRIQHGNITGLESSSSGRSIGDISGDYMKREASPSIPRFADVQHAPYGLGLEAVNVTDREVLPSAAKGRYDGTGLPSAYTHGGNATLQGSSSSTNRSVANQSYLPSLLRFDATDASNGSSSRPTREVQIRQTARLPMAVSSPQVKHFFPTQQDYNPKAASLSSSDGNHSSTMNEGSRSTSMTSLRESSIHGNKLRRPSQEGPPVSASAKSHHKIHTSPSVVQGPSPQSESSFKHRKTDSSSTAASARNEVRDVGEGSNLVSDRDDREEGSPAEGDVKRSVMAESPLSTVQASSPGHRSDVPNAATDQLQHQQSQGTIRPQGREDAHQKYLLLQQMHLDEVESHTPDHDGWLEPNNGCERILMPKPLLKNRKSATEIRSPDGMTFERNRRDGSASASASDAAKAQNILSGAGYSLTADEKRGRDETPAFFHHRMPPATPETNRTVSAIPSDRPLIPTRRSSQRRKHRTKSATPAATPAIKDNDDNDSIPDLATVLAQGRALDEERERWREQYRRSLLKANRSKSRDGQPKKVRYDEEQPLPDLSVLQDRNLIQDDKPIRQAKSTPDLRKSMSRGAYQDSNDVGIVNMCIAPFRDTSSSKNHQPRDQQQEKQLRRRSLSQGCLASSFFARRSRRRRADSMSAGEGRATTVQEKNVSREAMPEGADNTRGNAGGPGAFNCLAANSTVSSAALHANTKYGIAYSAPRPDIGRSVPKQETFAAGRHATTSQYHSHSNSDDLRNMLASSARQSEENYSQEKSKGKEVDLTGRSATTRGDRLELSHVMQSFNNSSIPSAGQEREAAYETPSLPVPPRKSRSNQASPSSMYVDLHPPTPVKDMTGSASEDDVVAAPSLVIPAAERKQREGQQSLEPLQQQKVVDKRASRQNNDKNPKRLTAQSATTYSSDSSYSPRSVAAREVWNTDDHTEEAFRGLFIQRPGSGNANGLRISSARSNETIVPHSPGLQSDSVMRDVDQLSAHGVRRSDSLYRASLDSKRNSAIIEKLVGSYISTLSPPAQNDQTLLGGSSTQESDIDLYRQGIRFGRVGGRTPVISPAYHSANEQDDPASDEEYEELGAKGTRARMDSFAASLVLNPEGNSPSAQEHSELPPDDLPKINLEAPQQADENAEQAETRFSSESIIDVVKNIVWPDPPSK